MRGHTSREGEGNGDGDGNGTGDDVGMDVGIGVGVSIGVDGGVLVAVGSWTLIGVRVAVGLGVAVGGTVGSTVSVAVGGAVGVAGGLGVLVGVGVGGGEGLQPLRKGSSNSHAMAQRQRKVPLLEAVLAPIMIFLTSGKRFRVAGYIIAHFPRLDHFSVAASILGKTI